MSRPRRRRRWPAAGGLVLLAAGCGPDPPGPASDASTLGTPGPPTVSEEDRGALLAEIEEIYRQGLYEAGLARVKKGLERSIDDAALHFYRGLFLQATGDFEAAEAAQTLALELDPEHYPSYRALGDLAQLRGAPAEAAEHFERCAAGLPDHAGCRYGLALARVDLGELDAAAEPLASAAEQLDRADVWSELGKLERRRRRPKEAISAFSRALALDRAHLPALLGMGQVLMAVGRRDEGQALLERHREEAATEDQLDALRRTAAQPDAPVEIQLQLARIYRSRDDLEAAEAALREALRHSPGFGPAALALANHLLHQGKADEADALVEGLMPAMSGDPAVLFLQGTIDLARGEEAAALAHFQASLAKGAGRRRSISMPEKPGAGPGFQSAPPPPSGRPSRACPSRQRRASEPGRPRPTSAWRRASGPSGPNLKPWCPCSGRSRSIPPRGGDGCCSEC